MEAEIRGLNSASTHDKVDQVPVQLKKKTIRKLLEQCERALESLGDVDAVYDDDRYFSDEDVSQGPELTRQGSAAIRDESEVDEVCNQFYWGYPREF